MSRLARKGEPCSHGFTSRAYVSWRFVGFFKGVQQVQLRSFGVVLENSVTVSLLLQCVSPLALLRQDGRVFPHPEVSSVQGIRGTTSRFGELAPLR